MFANIARSSILICVASVASLLLNHCPVRNAMAQTLAGADQVVEVPLEQLNQIQEELRYLRERDAKRHAWQESILKRLPPDNEFRFANESHGAGESGGLVSPLMEQSQKASGGKSCGQCGGVYPCQCPPWPAPCIECPHVSTLQPYFNVNVFGALKLDMLFNGARPLAPGTPFFLLPDSLLGFNQDTVDIHARQSTLGAAFSGPTLGNFQSGGLVVAMFYNDAVIVDQYGFLPLQAYGELTNEDWRFAAGLQFDVFAPAIPTVLPFSALAASGNSGNSFRGQVRLERFIRPAEDVQWTLQGALSEPITTTIDPAFGRLNDDTGWPNIEARVALGLGFLEGVGPTAKRPFEFGVSGVLGQVRNLETGVRQEIAGVWGISADFRWKLTECFGLTGEVFSGQALGTYNGGILQTTNPDTLEGIRTTGGWLETFVYWTPCLHSHVGYGIDDPVNRDVVAATAPIYNSTIYSNVLWDLNQTFRVGFEFTLRQTNYVVLPDKTAPGFHTQFQWSF